MKKIAIVTLILIISACSKSDDTPETDTSKIYGKWELYSYVYEDGSDYFDEVEHQDEIDMIEFISPDIYHWRDLHDYPTVYDAIGNFTFVGEILTFNETSFGGDTSDDKTVMTDVIIKDNILEYTENLSSSGTHQYGRAYYRKIN